MPGIDITPVELPFVNFSHDGRWALGVVANGTQRELTLYLAAAASLRAGAPRWRKLFGAEAQVTGLAYHGNALYLLSHRGSMARTGTAPAGRPASPTPGRERMASTTRAWWCG